MSKEPGALQIDDMVTSTELCCDTTLNKWITIHPMESSTTNAISTEAIFSNKPGPPAWPSGVNWQPETV